jgi:hypothetical protein
VTVTDEAREHSLAVLLIDASSAAPDPPPADARPEMDRQERVIFTVYVAMAVMIVAFLAVVGLAAALGA